MFTPCIHTFIVINFDGLLLIFPSVLFCNMMLLERKPLNSHLVEKKISAFNIQFNNISSGLIKCARFTDSQHDKGTLYADDIKLMPGYKHAFFFLLLSYVLG